MNYAEVVSFSAFLPSYITLAQQVAYFARVSNPKNQHASYEKLLDYLIEHKHWSPFEMVHITMHIVTTRDIARQLLRHRSFSFQEFSQRYAQINTDLHFRVARLQDKKNRQNSISTDDFEIHNKWSDIQRSVANVCVLGYEQALSLGIAKEVARTILPEGMTESSLYVSGSLRSWIHYIQVRTDPSTQKEHRDLALLCAEAIDPHFPYISRFVCGSDSSV
jgi:thymidylate synthase (FAD)